MDGPSLSPPHWSPDPVRSLLSTLTSAAVTLALLATGSALAGLLWFTAVGMEPGTAAVAGVVTFVGMIGAAYLSR